MPRKVTSLDTENLCRRYVAGESQKQLAEQFGISRSVVSRVLVERAIPIRGLQEAVCVANKRMPKEARVKRAAAAHAAIRGKRQSEEHRRKIAETVERRRLGVTRTESRLAMA